MNDDFDILTYKFKNEIRIIPISDLHGKYSKNI